MLKAECHYGIMQQWIVTIHGIKRHKENCVLQLRSVQVLTEKQQHLIIKHLTNSLGARVNKFYCTST
jgi:hypothetical protein